VTVLEQAGPFGSEPPAAFDVGAILGAAQQGEVLVIDAGGAEVSTFGGLAARAAAARRIEGALVDGACRDIDEIRAAGFRICSRHVTPTTGRGRIRVAGINVPVTCGGVRVAPGDFVVADETGVVFVPAARLAEARAIVEELDGRDRAFARAIDRGGDFGVVAKNLGHT